MDDPPTARVHRCSRRTPATPPMCELPNCSPDATSTWRRTCPSRSTGCARRLRSAGDRAPVGRRNGSAPPASAPRSSQARNWTRSSAMSVRAAAWSSSVKPSTTSTATTSTRCSGDSGCGCAATPSRTTSTATARRPGSWPSLPTAAAAATVTCWPASRPPASTAPPRSRARTALACGSHPRTASVPDAPLIVASEHGDGRVVVLGDSDLFGDDCIGALDHAALWLNIANWAARRPAGTPGRAAQHSERAARRRTSRP